MSDFKVGDTVLISTNYGLGLRKGTISRETKTLWIVDGDCRFNKRTRRSGSGWAASRLLPFDAAMWAIQDLKNIRRRLPHSDWDTPTDDAIKKIWAILKGEKP